MTLAFLRVASCLFLSVIYHKQKADGASFSQMVCLCLLVCAAFGVTFLYLYLYLLSRIERAASLEAEGSIYVCGNVLTARRIEGGFSSFPQKACVQ